MSEKVYELDGRRYRLLPSGWIDADTFIKPSLVITQELNLRFLQPTERPVSSSGPKTTAKRGGKRNGSTHAGLKLTDFRTNIEGTTWRRESTLAGFLAQTMRDKTGRGFVHHSVYRRQEVLFGEPPRFERHNTDKFNFRPAKFFILLNDIEARYGFYIEKPNHSRGTAWEWDNFIEAIDSTEVRIAVDRASAAHSLRWKVEESYGQGLRQRATWHVFAGPESWKQVSGALKAASSDNSRWLDVYLETRISPEESVAAGAQIAEPITATYLALLPLYDACA